MASITYLYFPLATCGDDLQTRLRASGLSDLQRTREGLAALSASAREILAGLEINKRTKTALAARLVSGRKIRSQVKNIMTVLTAVRDGTLPASALGKRALTKSHAASVKRESMVVLKWSAGIKVSILRSRTRKRSTTRAAAIPLFPGPYASHHGRR
jgi:hypothetical protein